MGIGWLKIQNCNSLHHNHWSSAWGNSPGEGLCNTEPVGSTEPIQVTLWSETVHIVVGHSCWLGLPSQTESSWLSRGTSEDSHVSTVQPFIYQFQQHMLPSKPKKGEMANTSTSRGTTGGERKEGYQQDIWPRATVGKWRSFGSSCSYLFVQVRFIKRK